MKKNGKKLIKKAFALMLAVVMAVPAMDYSAMFTVKAAAEITIKESGGYEEGAYVEWQPVEGADGYLAYVSQNGGAWEVLDDQLIRGYENYYRADALGLTAGNWNIKIEAATFNSNKEKTDTLAEKVVENIAVTEHDRSGFAWQGDGTASGAYNETGALKSDADVIYVTNATKNKVSLDIADAGTCVGLQNILNAYKAGKATKPLDVRIIGNVTDMVVMMSGDIVVENANKNNIGITIEGVGEDAVANGWGIRLSNSSNVEIRNLGFMNCDSNEGDNVSLENNNDHIWVHNCDFFYGEAGSDADQKKGDGMLDCKNSNWITFSYNHFWDSGKACLLGLIEGKETQRYITYHHNWFDHSDSRHPRIRYYNAHIYNNYYDGNAKYGIGAAEGGVSVFAESNYFRNCKYPMLISQQGSDLYDSNGKFQDPNDSSKFENGSIIKAYNNHIEGATSYIPYAASGNQTNSVQSEENKFVAYVALDGNIGNDSTDDADTDSISGEGDKADTDNAVEDDDASDSDDIAEDADTSDSDDIAEDADTSDSDDISDENSDADSDDSNVEDNNEDLNTDEAEISDGNESEGENSDLKAEISYAQASGLTADASVDFDAYEVNDRNEQVPSTVKTKKGENTYNNFDTDPGFYTYTPNAVGTVPTVVMAHAGRLNGGDFEWTFNNQTDDGSSDVNAELKEKCTNYVSSIVSIGGIQSTSTVCYFTVTVDPGNGDEVYTIEVEENHKLDAIAAPANIPDGKVAFDGWMKEGSPFLWDFENRIVTDDMTLVGKWLAEGESGGRYGVIPIGEEMVIHDFTTQGTSSAYVETITGELYTKTGTSPTYEYDGKTYKYTGHGLIMNNTVEITFETTTAAKVVLLFMNGATQSHYVDGRRYTARGGIIEAGVEAGEHFIKGYNNSGYLFAIIIIPGESVVEEPSYDLELYASNLEDGDHFSNIVTEDGFTITADGGHKVTVGSSKKTINNVSYTARLRTQGAGSPDYRSIKFETKGSATLYMACLSGSSTNKHKVGVATLNAQGSFEEYSGNISLDGEEMVYDSSDTSIDNTEHYISMELPKADTYYVYGKTGDIAFYYISVKHIKYTVTFNSNGGTAVAAKTIISGNPCVEPDAPTKAGYAFAGWYTDPDCTKGLEYDFDKPVTSDINLYAKWVFEHTVTFETNGGTDVASQTVKDGDPCTRPETNPTRDGYAFDGWYADGEYTTAYDFDNSAITEDTTIYAKWIKTYTVTFETNGGSDVQSQTIKDGDSCTRPETNPTRAGYAFDGWYSDADCTQEYNFNSAITEDTTIYAKWKLNDGLRISIEDPELLKEDGTAQYTYTGSAIMPEIKVTYNGKPLVKDTDYTVKYSNNIHAASKALGTSDNKLPKITVTGKGSYSGKTFKTFEILRKDLTGEGIVVSGVVNDKTAEDKTMTVIKGTKVAPVIYYNSIKLTAKDYEVNGTAGAKYASNDKSLTITGKGNYVGTLDLTLNVIDRGEKFMASFDKNKVNNLVYNGKEQKIAPVLNSGMDENTDYTLVYSDAKNAGTVKCTVIGLGKYTGCSVTKTYKIKPLVKSNNDFTVVGLSNNGYTFESQGVTLGDDLKVYIGEEKPENLLELGKDYKVAYSNNKKVSTTTKKAICKITFLGNYKGSKAISQLFTINKALLCKNSEDASKNTEGLEVVLPNMVSNGREGIYKSVPYVSIDGISLKKSDYNVEYYIDGNLSTPMDSRHKVSAGGTVYVKITGKGNYESTASEYIKAEYTVQDKPTNTIVDLSKATVTLRVKSREYTGKEQVDNVEKITVKVNGKPTTILCEEFLDNGITVEYVNNKAKGKATIVISGNGTKYVGSKTATFNITAYKFVLATN